MKKHSVYLLAAAAISVFVVAGCGGGGDGSSNASSGTPANTGGANNAASTPVVASTPLAAPPASAPVASSQPVTVGEALPSLSTPQAGSTAATASGPIGIWTESGNLGYSTIALVDPRNNLTTLNLLGSFVMSEDFSSLTVNGATWSLGSGVNFGTGGLLTKIDSGSGAYSAKQTLSGTISRGGTASTVTLTYNAANALSVTQDSVVGTWATTNASFAIASGGTVTGTLSGCNMTGTLMLATPGTNQNMYDMSLAASASTGCRLPAGVPLSGSAAIMFVPIKGTNGFQRSILYVLRAADNSFVAYGQVIKQ
ncbi:hypothetical protein [Burkholderia sp. S-53]|uniref:hypothetical protein n=1 Tax=Burkholderia sp. S-53 TaxID=2906514 RepID=UPI0021D38AD1|nr:hypothetical protein [Burkholderia sp. S-53]UXU90310.1 hypothetical protein LXM88_33955 [Burkholderia sp. S-53]